MGFNLVTNLKQKDMTHIKNNVINGMFGISPNESAYTNYHLSYKGRSVIVDYEHILHAYGTIPSNTVPIEMYPYGDDIYFTYIKLDERFEKVDIEELIKDLDEALENEQ